MSASYEKLEGFTSEMAVLKANRWATDKVKPLVGQDPMTELLGLGIALAIVAVAAEYPLEFVIRTVRSSFGDVQDAARRVGLEVTEKPEAPVV